MTIGVILCLCFACNKEVSPALSPDEALETFHLADPNLRIELVASEPMVQDPVAITFDEGGRLWVAEMLGFMQDIDGSGEADRIGRISVLFDDDGDGQMDRRQTFLDSLILPRALALVKGGVLVAENMPLWFVSDTDGDFKADGKVLIDSLYGGLGVPEHSANGLLRGMDNWLYNAKSKYRYRKIGTTWVKDTTEFRGQWGICHDDAGRLFYNYNWSQLHADLVPPNALLGNAHHTPTSGIDHGLTLDRRVFPIRSTTAINRGYVPGTLDEKGRILEFASACGPLVNRGHALPESYYGDAFVCEPTANLIKQNEVLEEGFMLRAENTYQGEEFLASTDERFRPISLASGPDGALYVVDMYKGIIQHAPYMTDYLREVTLKRGLDTPIHMGRIWRITSANQKVETYPDLSQMTPVDLIGQLNSDNGWTRDTAQRLLVAHGDSTLVAPLKHLLETGTALGQLHALWTLEGLGHQEPEVYLKAVGASDPRVAQAGLRLATRLAEDNPEVGTAIERLIQDSFGHAPPLVQLQMVLSGSIVSRPLSFEISHQFLKRYGTLPLARDAVLSSLEDRELDMLRFLLDQSPSYHQNQEIMFELLASAIANSDSKTDIAQLNRLLDSFKGERTQWIKNALVNGMGNTATDDSGIAATFPAHIDAKRYAQGRQGYLNICASCHGTNGEGMKRFAPPLKKSEWVTGDDQKLAMLLLHGMQGPVEVNGKTYDSPDILPEMPSFSTLQNEDIADIATYIRNAWGNSAEELTSRTVGSVRFRTQGKLTPWTATELDTLIFDIDN